MTGLMALLVLLGEPTTKENPFLTRARSLYQAMEPKACLQQVEQSGQWASTSDERVELEVLGGLCAFFLGDEAGATERFERALRLSPDAHLPPHTSPKIAALFQRLKQARFAKADGPTASPPPPLTPNPVAPLPTEPLVPTAQAAPPRSSVGPIVMFAGALAVAAAGIVFGVMAKDFERKANGLTYASERDQWKESSANARLFSGTANVSFGLAGAVALGAGAWLWLSF